MKRDKKRGSVNGEIPDMNTPEMLPSNIICHFLVKRRQKQNRNLTLRAGDQEEVGMERS